MKILQVNKFHYPRGGADKYFLWLSQALRNTGHEVAVFSMNHPKNLPTPWSPYFASRISFNEGNLKDKFRAPGRVLYSLAVKRKFARLLADFQPDLIHIHNIYHHLSPSILTVARRRKIPIVMHLHDYNLISPDYNLLSAVDSPEPKKYYRHLFDRTVKNSRLMTALIVFEMYLHHSILKIYQKSITLFIAPSHFMKNIMVKAGWSAEKIQVVYNPYSPDLAEKNLGGKEENEKEENEKEENEKSDSYLIFFGRLTKEKGVATLLEAAALTGQKVKIAGTGTEEENLKKLAVKLNAPAEFLGFKKAVELRPLIEKAAAVVIPSVCAENMSLSLLEALNLGKIIIASRIGGIPEVIQDGKNGLLFEAGNAADLARQIRHLEGSDLLALSRTARESAAEFNPEKNLNTVLEIYKKLLDSKKQTKNV